MSQARKPPRLWLRTEDRTGRKTVKFWVIKDGQRNIRTGCIPSQIAEAERALSDYITRKHVVEHNGHASQTRIGDVLSVYLDDKAPSTAAPKTTEQILSRLNDFFGDKTVSQVKGKICRDYAAKRGTQSGARRDLEYLRAALRHYHKEHGLDVLPLLTLPPKSLPREVYLTRTTAALLLWTSLGWEKQGGGQNACWVRRRDQKRSHIARLILIGLYTGTRPGAIRALQKTENTEGGWANLETGVIYRRAKGERVAHNKAKTPVKIAPRLLVHMERWKRLDQGIRYYVHYNGRPIEKLNKAFRSAVAAAAYRVR